MCLTVCVDQMVVLVKQCTDAKAQRLELFVSKDLKDEVQGACEVFARLVVLVKQHDSNQAVLVSAVKWGAKFVEQLLKVAFPLSI